MAALRGPELKPAVMPFDGDQVASIKHAQTTILGTGYFSGMLPVGDYTLGAGSFRVIARDETSAVWGA
jgi:hypothetical protein